MLLKNYPPELDRLLDGEKADFIAFAKRSSTFSGAIFLMLFGLFWTGFSGMFVAVMLGPVLMGKEVHFSSNGTPVVAGPGNLGPLLGPGIFIGFFVLIGLAMITGAIFMMISRNAWFAGTAKRLIVLKKKSVRSIDWEQFNGDIEISGDNEKASIQLQMRTGHMQSQKNGPSRYVPDTIYMGGIRNAFEIEPILRRRIKENDPTPAKA